LCGIVYKRLLCEWTARAVISAVVYNVVRVSDEGRRSECTTISAQQNTVVCSFDPTSLRISAFEIHEWIHEQLQVPEHSVTMIQIDGPRRQVCIKSVDFQFVQGLIQTTNGQLEYAYKHASGEISPVRIEMAGMGKRRVRIANLPSDIPEGIIWTDLSQYSEVKTIQDEMWSRAYRYAVANCIKIVVIALKKHTPSHMTIAGNRVRTSYEDQTLTCYGCGEMGTCIKFSQKGGEWEV